MYEYTITQIIKVVDGDTIDVMFDVGCSIFRKERVRLLGIDSPETRTTNEIEKKLGIESKEFVEKWLNSQNKLVAITTKDDKYGRILAKIYGTNKICLNEDMVSKGFAWYYDGGTKRKDFDSLLEQRKKI